MAFGSWWVMSRASLFSVPVPQGHCPLRENSVYHCFWQPRSQPDAVDLGGPWSQQRWLIPPQWLIEELQGEAIYNQTFQVQCSSIFSGGGGQEWGWHIQLLRCRSTATPTLSLEPHSHQLTSASPFSQAFCSAVWVLSSWYKILLITHQLLKE